MHTFVYPHAAQHTILFYFSAYVCVRAIAILFVTPIKCDRSDKPPMSLHMPHPGRFRPLLFGTTKGRLTCYATAQQCAVVNDGRGSRIDRLARGCRPQRCFHPPLCSSWPFCPRQRLHRRRCQRGSQRQRHHRRRRRSGSRRIPACSCQRHRPPVGCSSRQ